MHAFCFCSVCMNLDGSWRELSGNVAQSADEIRNVVTGCPPGLSALLFRQPTWHHLPRSVATQSTGRVQELIRTKTHIIKQRSINDDVPRSDTPGMTGSKFDPVSFAAVWHSRPQFLFGVSRLVFDSNNPPPSELLRTDELQPMMCCLCGIKI